MLRKIYRVIGVRLKEMLAIIRHRGPNDSTTYAARGTTVASRVAIGNNCGLVLWFGITVT